MRLSILPLLLVPLFLLAPVHATSYLSYSLDAMLQTADIIVFAEVKEVKTVIINEKPWQEVSLEPIRVLKGTEEKAAQAITFYGGVSEEGLVIQVDGMPDFSEGMKVLFMRYDARYASPLVGFSQGMWELQARGLVDKQGRILAVDAAGSLGFLKDFQARAQQDTTTVPEDTVPEETSSDNAAPANETTDSSAPEDSQKPDGEVAQPVDALKTAQEATQEAAQSEEAGNAPTQPEAKAQPDKDTKRDENEAQPAESNTSTEKPSQTSQNDNATTINDTKEQPKTAVAQEDAANTGQPSDNKPADAATDETTEQLEPSSEPAPNAAETETLATPASDSATAPDAASLGIKIDTDVVLDAIAQRLTELAEEQQE